MPGRRPTDKDLDAFRTQLEMMLALLSGDISQLEAEALGRDRLAGMKGEDGESYFQEFSLELLQRDESTLKEILDALDRIKERTFGRCEDCENWIQKARLNAVPHARKCIGCQRAAESD